MNKRTIFVIGFILGCLSWAICPLVSDRFEPFDTGIGFLIGQVIMAVFTVYIGFIANYKKLLLAVLGLYLGQNAYAYVVGGSEAKAWAVLLLFTSIFLCIIPLVFGLSAKGINVFLQHRKTNS
jgi:hypothetical protein